MNQNAHVRMLLADIRLASVLYEADNFVLMNIIANRVMSDASFGPNPEFSLIGFFLKHVATKCLAMRPKVPEAEFSATKQAGQHFIKSLDAFSKDTQAETWKGFHAFLLDTNKIGSADIEKDIYNEDPEISQGVTSYLIEWLSANRSALADPRCLLLRNLLIEIGRVHRVFGFSLQDTITTCALIALERYFEYFSFQRFGADSKANLELVEANISPYIDRIVDPRFVPPNYDLIAELFFELITKWRESYIVYGDLSRGLPLPEERPLKLPEESKKKLGEVIGKALDKELKGLKEL